MLRSFKFRVDKQALTQATVAFHVSYGSAMARWASLETALYQWFAATTGMSDAMARAIFYGARGFMARAEMLEAAVDHTTRLSTEESEFMREALKRAKQYCSFRNKIAHGAPRAVFREGAEETKVHFVITQGHESPSPTEETLSVDDLNAADDRIHTLADCVRDMLPTVKRPEARSPAECLRLVRELPTVANSRSIPTGAASAQSPEARPRRNKKAFRASRQSRRPPEKE